MVCRVGKRRLVTLSQGVRDFPRPNAVMDLDFQNGRYFYKGVRYSSFAALIAGSDMDFARASQAWGDDGTVYASGDAHIEAGVGYYADQSRTNYYSSPLSPVTKSISLAAGNYNVTCKGSGSVTVSGGPTGTATESAHVSFTLASTTTVTFTVSGSLTWANVQNSLIPGRPILASSAPTTRASAILTYLADFDTSSGLTVLFQGKLAKAADNSSNNYSRIAYAINGSGQEASVYIDKNSTTNTAQLVLRDPTLSISTGLNRSYDAPIRIATRLKANDHMQITDGDRDNAAAVTARGMPTFGATSAIGSTTTSSHWAAVIERYTILQRAMSDDELTTASAQSTAIAAYGESLTGGSYYPIYLGGYFDKTRTVKRIQAGGYTAPQILGLMQAAPIYRSWISIIWAGTNGGYSDPTAMRQAIADMVALLGHDRYIVVSPINGNYANERSGGSGVNGVGADYATIIANETYLSATYGVRFYSIRRQLIDNGLSALSISPTSQDIIDVADDIVPSSLRTDQRHLTTGANSANTFVAQKFRDKLVALGY